MHIGVPLETHSGETRVAAEGAATQRGSESGARCNPLTLRHTTDPSRAAKRPASGRETADQGRGWHYNGGIAPDRTEEAITTRWLEKLRT